MYKGKGVAGHGLGGGQACQLSALKQEGPALEQAGRRTHVPGEETQATLLLAGPSSGHLGVRGEPTAPLEVSLGDLAEQCCVLTSQVPSAKLLAR